MKKTAKPTKLVSTKSVTHKSQRIDPTIKKYLKYFVPPSSTPSEFELIGIDHDYPSNASDGTAIFTPEIKQHAKLEQHPRNYQQETDGWNGASSRVSGLCEA